jgi:hypothetical protein
VRGVGQRAVGCDVMDNRVRLTINGVISMNLLADQCKSKYQRLMQEFELYKSVTGFPATRTLVDKDWDQLIEQRQRFAPQLRVLKERGFPHAETCALITGAVVERTDAHEYAF